VHRAHLSSCAAVVAATARTAEAQLLVESGWAHELVADRATLRAAAPRVQALGADAELARDPAARTARLPSLAHRVARQALADGAPVLVQVPRAGYAPGLACDRCRAPARCAVCSGPLGIAAAPGPGGSRVPACRWCARPAATFDCPYCHGTKLRASVVGSTRTAEELGRAFPGAAVRVSGRGSGVLASVPAGPALVVATPGAEPVAEGGYGAALLLDSWALLGRADLRAGEETLRRWVNAATLVRSASAGGQVVVAADAAHPVVQALVRWDPAGLAARELADRRALGFPPVTRIAALSASPATTRWPRATSRRTTATPAGPPAPVTRTAAPSDGAEAAGGRGWGSEGVIGRPGSSGWAGARRCAVAGAPARAVGAPGGPRCAAVAQ